MLSEIANEETPQYSGEMIHCDLFPSCWDRINAVAGFFSFTSESKITKYLSADHELGHRRKKGSGLKYPCVQGISSEY